MNRIPMGGRQNANPQEIILMQADVNYTKVYFLNGRNLVVATTLKTLENRLTDCSEFFRTHKSFLVNLNFIKEYDLENKKDFVQMQNNIIVTISRRKKVEFERRVLTNRDLM